MALLPFWLIVATAVLAPLCREPLGRRLVVGLVLLLGAHNFVAGMWLIQAPVGDYYRARAAWLLEHVGADDLVITFDKDNLTRYLRYEGRARVVNLFTMNDQEERLIRARLAANDGAVYVTEPVLDPPPFVCRSLDAVEAGGCERRRRFVESLGWRLEVVADTPTTGRVLVARP